MSRSDPRDVDPLNPSQPAQEDASAEEALIQEDFDAWVADMESELDQLMEQLPEEVADQLDYSPQSLIVLEALLLDVFETPEGLMSHSDGLLLDRLSRYLGQSLIDAADGEGGWGINLDRPEVEPYQVPVVQVGVAGVVYTPATQLLEAVVKGDGEVLSRLVDQIQA